MRSLLVLFFTPLRMLWPFHRARCRRLSQQVTECVREWCSFAASVALRLFQAGCRAQDSIAGCFSSVHVVFCQHSHRLVSHLPPKQSVSGSLKRTSLTHSCSLSLALKVAVALLDSNPLEDSPGSAGAVSMWRQRVASLHLFDSVQLWHGCR